MRKGEKFIKALVVSYRKNIIPFTNEDLIHYILNMDDEKFNQYLNLPEEKINGQKDYYGHEIDLSNNRNIFDPHTPYDHIFTRRENDDMACLFFNLFYTNFYPNFKSK